MGLKKISVKLLEMSLGGKKKLYLLLLMLYRGHHDLWQIFVLQVNASKQEPFLKSLPEISIISVSFCGFCKYSSAPIPLLDSNY